MKQLDQPAGLAKRQRPQQHAIDDGKNGGVGADAERERQDGDEGKPGLAPQHTAGVADVLKQGEMAHG